MHCPQCGKELSDNARFCSFCGAEIKKLTSEAPGRNSLDSGSPTDLKAAIDTNRARSRRRLPIILIVALALALATSVAYAAYYVYTNVWLPSQQTQEQQQPTAEEPTYTVNTVTEEVSVPSNPYSSPGQRSDETWEYDQIVSSVQSDAIDSINRRIQENMTNDVQNTENGPNDAEILEDSGGAYPATLSKSIKITYMDNNIACFLDSGYQTGWGAHGWNFRQSQTYDLKTGKLIDP